VSVQRRVTRSRAGSEGYFDHNLRKIYDFHFEDRPNCGTGCSTAPDYRGEYSTDVFVNRTVDIIYGAVGESASCSAHAHVCVSVCVCTFVRWRVDVSVP
jgi:hypothetical protein